jgi:hypothetical protein
MSRPKFNVLSGIEHLHAAFSRRSLRRFAAMLFPVAFGFICFGGADSRLAIVISAAAQRRHAVARDMPTRQQMGFHRTPSARSHTMRASSPSIHVSHAKVSSMRLMACGEGELTLDWWLGAHRKYFARQAAREGFTFCDRIDTVFERFTLVWPPYAADK